MNIQVEKQTDAFQMESVETTPREIRFNEIVLKPELYGFREPEDFSKDALKALAEDIGVNGLLTGLLVAEQSEGGYLALNGHRRHHAIRINIDQKVVGFSDDMMVPALVVKSGASELAMVARAIASNVQVQSLSAEGRQKAVLRLKQLGMPVDQIARVVSVSQSTVARDLVLASDERMMDHVRNKRIQGTVAAMLLKVAQDNGREDALHATFNEWLEQTLDAIDAEQERRSVDGEDPLPVNQTYPQRYFTSELAEAWKIALMRNLPLTMSVFNFRASISQELGKPRRLVIDAFSKSLDEISAKDLGTILKRVADLADKLQPEVASKFEAEKVSKALGSEPGKTGAAARQLLKTLGLEDAEDESGVDENAADDETTVSAEQQGSASGDQTSQKA